MSFLKIRDLAGSSVIKYSITGALGFISNIALFSFFLNLLQLPPNFAAFMSYFVAAGQNYLINHYWSFSHQAGDAPPSLSSALKFAISSLIGVSVNILLLNIFLIFSSPIIVAQILAVALSFVSNYFMARYFVYKK